MNTTQSKIRPRVRDPEKARTEGITDGISKPVAQSTADVDSPAPLPVLARLPEVSLPSDQGKLSLPLDWLKRLDWQQVRRVKLDPNWVAGGVLSLVLLLLLVITFNRGAKTGVETEANTDAPAWSTAGKTSQSPNASPGDATPVGASGSAANTSLVANTPPVMTSGAVANQSVNAGPGTYAGEPAAQTPYAGPQSPSLEGIYYPQTPYASIAPQPVVNHAPAGQSHYGNEIRTAQRDVGAVHQTPAYVGPTPASQARFEGGIITRPQE